MLTRRGTRHQPSEQAGERWQDAGPAAETKAGRLCKTRCGTNKGQSKGQRSKGQRTRARDKGHRRQWVEDRIHELAGIFGVAIWGYAVMSNHVHVVVQILPEEVSRWSNAEIVERWMRLYPRQDQDPEMRAEVLAGNAERIEVLRERLSNLSWFMRCLVEPIARAGETGVRVEFPCIQALFGHATVMTTEIYTHVSIVALKAAHAAIHPGAKLERGSSALGEEVEP